MAVLAPQTTTTSKTADLPLSLAEAKAALRISGSDLDTEVEAALKAAVEWCETESSRALRVAHTITQTYRQWPVSPVRFDHQPVKAIISIAYYDTSGGSQVVSSSNYRLLASGDGAAALEFDDGYSLPSLDVRSDAVTITYTAGYDDIGSVPEQAKQAMRLKLRQLFGTLTDREMQANEMALRSLIGQLKWRPYR